MHILVVIGHPRSWSFCEVLGNAYVKGAHEAGHTTEIIQLAKHIKDTSFHLIENQNTGNHEEPIRHTRRSMVKNADHIVFVFPTWWYTAPAILKWWFDRLFIPKFSHQYTGFLKRKKLLAGRTGSIYCTCWWPWRTYIQSLWHPGIKRLKQTLHFVGIKKKYSHLFTKIAPHLRTKKDYKAMLSKMNGFGMLAK